MFMLSNDSMQFNSDIQLTEQGVRLKINLSRWLTWCKNAMFDILEVKKLPTTSVLCSHDINNNTVAKRTFYSENSNPIRHFLINVQFSSILSPIAHLQRNIVILKFKKKSVTVWLNLVTCSVISFHYFTSLDFWLESIELFSWIGHLDLKLVSQSESKGIEHHKL